MVSEASRDRTSKRVSFRVLLSRDFPQMESLLPGQNRPDIFENAVFFLRFPKKKYASTCSVFESFLCPH